MATLNKSEINLEISTGFFRIATQDVVYNITVLNGHDKSVAPTVSPAALGADMDFLDVGEDPALSSTNGLGDDYYKHVSTDLYRDIGQLAKSLSSTIMEIPMEDRRTKRAELDEAGEKIEDAKNQLRDIVAMTEKATMEIMDHVEKVQEQTDDVKELLSLLKDHPAFQVGADDEAGEEAIQASAGLESVRQLQEKLAQAKELLDSMQGPGGSESGQETPPVAAVETRTRFLFELDTVFQTIYELCTNEQVKSHIATAREQAATFFDAEAFIDRISERINGASPDGDNFLTISLSDILQSLLEACSNKKIQNLLKKMDANQGEIFLDQSLPLEAPPTEEVAVEGAVAAEQEAAPDAPEGGESDPRLAELAAIIGETAALAGQVADETEHFKPISAAMSLMSLDDQRDIFKKIENAFTVTTNICEDITKITETLSFQDLSGQQIMKIIKLLSDFQFQLLALVVSFGSQLRSKERNADITPEESKRLAQEDVDRYLRSMGAAAEGEETGPLDQESVNKILEEMGF